MKPETQDRLTAIAFYALLLMMIVIMADLILHDH